MDARWLFAVFVLVLILVSVSSPRYRVPPFFARVGGTLLFGLLAGPGMDRTVAEIVFDLVGTGAVGSVIVASGIADEALRAMAGTVPVPLIPFPLAALVKTVQGSRVVTAVIVAPLLAASGLTAPLAPIPLVLMGGAPEPAWSGT